MLDALPEKMKQIYQAKQHLKTVAKLYIMDHYLTTTLLLTMCH
jgi:hypothetical protein